ncbi:hypothetical protein BH23ACT11_BH23ACT11_10730 [soil metagenome]
MEDRSQVSGFSKRLYRALLVAYPKEFRRQYSEQLEQAFGDLCREELQQRGKKGLLVLWMRTLGDLAISGFSARSGLPLFTFGLIRIGGIVMVVGGILQFVYWYLSFADSRIRGAPTGQPLLDRLVLLPGPTAILLFAAGLLVLGISLMRGAARGRRWAKILSVASIGLATVSVVASAVRIVIEMVVGPFFIGGPRGVAPDSLQVILLDISSLLVYSSLAIASLTLGGALLLYRALGRWWVLLPVVGILTVPQAMGLLRVATLGPFLAV